MKSNPKKDRIPIPKNTQRQLLVECGHKCSVPLCNESSSISFHHINSDPSDNQNSNIIVLCRNHHEMADRGKIDRKECYSYKERLKQINPEETLKEKVEREGIDVTPEHPFVSAILWVGRKYMMWRYKKPNASVKREIAVLAICIPLCFVPLILIPTVMKSQLTTEWAYFALITSILGLILCVFFVVIFERRCRKCHGYFGIEVVESKLVSENHFKDRIVSVFRNTYRCIYCGNTYHKNEKVIENLED